MDEEQLRRWREADAQLDRLLDLPEAERTAALAALDEPLRTLVGRLLQADRDEGLLDRALPPPVATGGVPQRIGPWHVGEEIGRGGMAVVYATWRELSGGRQHAALKLLTVAALAGDGRGRFLREHQALARLAHPRIAALLDAGVLDDGTPYLAMQRVSGERIDQWCRARPLEPRAVVELFLQVCDAVAYANRHLVVHRDLKPGNILVDGEGSVRLLDFGIARLLDEVVDGEGTGTGVRALTPQYAAPEQFAGTDTGTAVDVYGLGAVLYQLMTGRAPRGARHEGDAPVTLASRAVAEEARDAWRERFRRSLRGDLDAILLKALDADPHRRYPDAGALADDLRRWLARRPVRAAVPSPWYRLRCFAARHRGAVLAGGLLALAVGAGLASAWWQARRIAQEAARTQEVKAFLVSLLQSASPEGPDGLTERTADVLARGAMRARHALDANPPLQAELLVLIGRLQAELGQFDAARATLDAAEPAIAASPHALSRRAELALARAQVESGAGDPAAMRAALVAAQELAPRLEGDAGTRLAAMLRLRLSYALAQLGEHDAAAQRLEEGARFVARLSPADPAMAADVSFYHAQAAMFRDDDETAWAHLQRSLESQRQASARDEAAEIAILAAMATVAGRLGRSADRIALGEEILAATRRQYPPDHPVLAGKVAALAVALADAGRLGEAEPLSREALEIRRKVLPAGSARLAVSIYNHASLLLDLGQAEAALPLLQEASASTARAYGADDTRSLMVASRELGALVALGEVAAARGKAAELERSAQPQDGAAPSRQQRIVLSRVARGWLDLGEPARALALIDGHALDGPEASPDVVIAVGVIRLRAQAQVDATEAERSAAQLRARLDRGAAVADGRIRAEAWATLGLHAHGRGRRAQAQADLDAAKAAVVPPRPAAVEAQIRLLESALR